MSANQSNQQTNSQTSSFGRTAFDLRSKKLSKIGDTGKVSSVQSPAPRKKLERLNSKTGADIIDVYKSKYANELSSKQMNFFSELCWSLFIFVLCMIGVQTSPDPGFRVSAAVNGLGLMVGQHQKIEKGTVVDCLKEKIVESEKENELITCTNEKAVLMPDNLRPVIEMKISKKKKIVFV